MNGWTFSFLFRLIVGTMLWTSAIIAPTRAADLGGADGGTLPPASPSADRWTFAFAPYFWMAGLNGDVKAAPNIPDVHVDASFGDILNHLNFAAMGASELRKERYGLLTDFFYVNTDISKSGDLAPRIPGSLSSALDTKVFSATASIFYALQNSKQFEFDVLAGARVWSVDNAVTITLPSRVISGSGSFSWIDPIIGARARINFTDKFSATVYGDFGGFDVGSQNTWQAIAMLNYAWNSHWTTSAGYRYLSVDYSHGGHIWDVDMGGPVVAASYRF